MQFSLRFKTLQRDGTIDFTRKALIRSVGQVVSLSYHQLVVDTLLLSAASLINHGPLDVEKGIPCRSFFVAPYGCNVCWLVVLDFFRYRKFD